MSRGGHSSVSFDGLDFSDFLDAWQLRRSAITIEGTLYEDGEFYVVDRNPGEPSSLIRIAKASILGEPEEARTMAASGGDRQLHRLIVKQGVPLVIETVIVSDMIFSELRRKTLADSVNAKFTNPTSNESAYFSVFDVYAGKLVVDNQLFAPGESKSVTLDTLGTFWGQAKYRRSDSDWVTKEQILDGDEIIMV
jgi:hypothetical protein